MTGRLMERGLGALLMVGTAAASCGTAWAAPERTAKAAAKAGGGCTAAFNPGAGPFLVVASRHADWSAAWQAAQGLRQKRHPAEVVPMALFAGSAEQPAWAVLLGATPDRAAADKLAASHPGALVVDAPLAPELHGPPVKPLGVQTMPGAIWDVAGDVVTIVEGRDVAIVKPREGGRPPELVKVSKGILRSDAHLAVVHKGDSHVLDQDAHWWQMVDGKPMGPVSPPATRPPGETAAGDLRFRRQHGAPGARGLAVERGGKPWGLLHLGFLEATGPGGAEGGLVFAKDGRLAVTDGRDLHRFEILAEPAAPRLVKVCAKVEAKGARPGLRPLRVKMGSQEAATGSDGRFESWTADWGLLRLGLQPEKEAVLSCGGKTREFGPWNPGLGGGVGDNPVDVPLWGEQTVSVRVQARCGKE